MKSKKIISVKFFRLSSNREPVRELLLSLAREDKKIVGEDIKTVELGWPVGMPVAEKLDTDLWQVRSTISRNRRVRVLFTVFRSQMVLLHAFIKKTPKTPKGELDLGKRRKNRVLGGGSK